MDLDANHEPRSLKVLLQEIGSEYSDNLDEVQITGITADSRQVKPGHLFVAVPGETTDGHRYISDAIRRGAPAVAGMQPLGGLEVPYVRITDTRKALPHLAAAFFDYPARQLVVIGVTGTDGKTTTSNLIYNILDVAGIPSGMITTVNAVIGERVLDTGFHVTTPDPVDVQRYLAEMVAAGITHVVLEATSHGLAQYRVDACEFDINVVTNITHEHLDFHQTYEAYRTAKARMFTELASNYPKLSNPPRGAVLNRDDRSYEYLADLVKDGAISYGFDPLADLRALDIFEHDSGMHFTASGRGYHVPIQTHLHGIFNIYNCLAAAAAGLLVMNLEPQYVREGIAAFKGVPGRMEQIDYGQSFTAIVDFAHTPNALRSALEAGRRLAAESGRVIAVFGSAGLRDRAKRRMMAETSVEVADLTVLTAEDPRTESLEKILEEMAQGAVSAGGVEGKNFWRIPDRGEAIRYAVSIAKPGDVVLACGKGHEQSMCFGITEYAWDERTAMKAALSQLLGKAGPDMPFLPTQKEGGS
jgi:UDP-N-acetylmuramoyl-L-alanyl-D-glutamate--2,6-diaminopimelate ligase